MTKRKELWLVSLLSAAAGLRVLIFLAAFPFFSDIDEDLHFDMVVRYSHGGVPGTFDLLTSETLDSIVPYASPEYLQRPETFPGGTFGLPLAKRTDEMATEMASATREDWGKEVNFESSAPPLYYAVAGIWRQAGRVFGLSGLDALYWIRLLNVPLMMAIVWLGYAVERRIDSTRLDLRLGVPLLLAFFPQSAFFTMNSDILSPICGGALFLCVLRWWATKRPTLLLGLWSGLAMAACYLTKLSNLPILMVALVAIGLNSLARGRRSGSFPVAALVALILCALLPVAAWVVWLQSHFGDLTGAGTKIALLGWTRKPLAEWWNHPIFTIQGLKVFWSDLLTTFWRGELKWLGRPLRSIMDEFVAVSSLILLAAALLGARRKAGLSPFQERAIAFSVISFLATVAFFAALSIQFDFGKCINPSRAHPYFTSGRLLSGALIPFAVAYVYGLVCLLRRFHWALPLVVLAGIVIFVTVSDVFLTRDLFVSQYNWFHR